MRWTEQQIQIIRDNFATLATKEVMRLLGDPDITEGQVNMKAHFLGIPKNRKVLVTRLRTSRAEKQEKKFKTIAPLRNKPPKPLDTTEEDFVLDGIGDLRRPYFTKLLPEASDEESEESFNERYYSDGDFFKVKKEVPGRHKGGRYK